MHCHDEQCVICMHELAKNIISNIADDPRDQLIAKVSIYKHFRRYFFYFQMVNYTCKREIYSQKSC